jgi:probable rRNA maturation factor
MPTIRNLTKRTINGQFILRIAEFVLAKEKATSREFSLVVVGQKRMTVFNETYRHKKGATDVLAFSEKDASPIFPYVNLDQGLGEIVICPGIIQANAKKYNSSFQAELVRIVIHGILHLIGYDHEKSQKAAEEMGQREEVYFKQLKNSIQKPKCEAKCNDDFES